LANAALWAYFRLGFYDGAALAAKFSSIAFVVDSLMGFPLWMQL
jgi:hypothetical protein